MGVNLSPIVEATEIDISSLNGKRVAIDAYNTLYQFLSTIRQRDGSLLTDDGGRVTSHLSGLLYRTAHLAENGVRPSYVFDGKPTEMKRETIEERRIRREKAEAEYEKALEEGDLDKAFTKAQQTSRITPDILQSSKDLLSLLGIPIVQAPGDGEAQASYMCAVGDVYACASQDYDSLLFGTPLLLRNLTVNGKRKVQGQNVYKTVLPEIIDSPSLLTSLNITREQLVDACILIGTDFNHGISGIGPKKALKLIRQHGSLETIAHETGIIPDGYEEVRDIFLRSAQSNDYDLSEGILDTEGAVTFMTDRGFSEPRVRAVVGKIERARSIERDRRKQRSLDDWFRYRDAGASSGSANPKDDGLGTEVSARPGHVSNMGRTGSWISVWLSEKPFRHQTSGITVVRIS